MYDIFKDGVAHFLHSACWECCFCRITRDRELQPVRVQPTAVFTFRFTFVRSARVSTLVMASEGKRKVLSLQQRVDVLRRLDSGVSCRAIAKDISCRIRSEREAVMREWETGGRSDLKYVKKRKTIYDQLNLLVWEWFCAARSKELPVSGRLIQVCRHLHFPCPLFERIVNLNSALIEFGPTSILPL